MKRFELAIALALVPLDFLMLIFAAITAYFLRFEGFITQYRPVIFELDFSVYIQSALLMSLLWILIYAASGLYSVRHPRKILTEIKKVCVSGFLGFSAITILISLRGELFNSRFILLTAAVLGILYVIIGRIIIRYIRFAFYKHNIGVRRVVLVGDDKHTMSILKSLKANYRDGLFVIKHLKNVDQYKLDKFSKSIHQLQPDMILVASLDLSRQESELLLDFARDNHIQFAYVADLFKTKVSNTNVTTIAGAPVIEIKQTPLEGWGRIIKRLFDLVVGSLLIVLLSPLMLIIAVLIKVESRGAVIYKNQRVGKNGLLFNTYKFRRLKSEFCTGFGYDHNQDAEKYEEELIETRSEKVGPLYKILDDPRNTRIGAFIEKTSLDELPQFFNVILGNMSLVGPRPHQPREVGLYKNEERRVLAIKPGITGISQISGRSDLEFEEEVKLDTFYMENWTLRRDISLLIKTPIALLKKHKS